MSKTLRWLIVLSGLCLASGLSVVTWRHLSKPTILTLAVGPAGFDDAALVAAWSRALAADHAPLRLSVIPTSGPVEALSRLTKGEAQLAVIRSDAAAPERVRVYRPGFSGHKILLCGRPDWGACGEPFAPGLSRAAVGILLQQPVLVIARDEGPDRNATLLGIAENPPPHALLLEGANEPLRHSVGFGLA